MTRYINKVLDELILSPVYEKVNDIEKYKKDPNYDGNLKEIIASG